jgi:hypothetical protein
LSVPFGQHAEVMADSQMLWWEALGRPGRDEGAVEDGLRAALEARGLDWDLKRYGYALKAWDAWATWDALDSRAARAARDAWDAWDAWATWDALDSWSARAALDSWDTRAAWSARAAGDPRGAIRASWDAWEAWDAWDSRAARDAWNEWAAWDAAAALTVQYAALNKWTFQDDPMLLTAGLRNAYRNGLGVALPVGPRTLGWAIDGDKR